MTKEEKDLAAKTAATEVKENAVEVKRTFSMADLGALEEFKAKDGEMVHGLEDIDSTDIKIPGIKLLQSLSKEVSESELGKAGQFFNKVTKEVTDFIEVTLLCERKGRSRFAVPFKKGAKPICMSTDNVTGRGEPGISCAKCEHSQWVDGSDSKQTQACSMGYTWVGIQSNGEPFRFSIRKSGIAPTRDFLTNLQMKFPKYPAYCVIVRITSTKVIGAEGTYYVPSYEIVGVNRPEDVATYKALLEGLSTFIDKAMEKDYSEAEESDGMDGEGEAF